jgi:UDP-glucose 4-epimerase
MNNCLVIGGSGFIGSAVVKKLKKTKRRIIVIARSNKPEKKLPKNTQYIKANLDDLNLLESLINKKTEIIHLAHTSVPKTSLVNPIKDLEDNLYPSIRFFDLISRTKIKKIVFVSSGGTVYGQTNKLPIKEESSTNPICPYGITKLAIEKYAKLYNKIRGLPVTIVRPSNAYGPGQNPFAPQGFIATAIASIINNKTINLFGKIGTVRDYIYIDDVAEGVAKALDYQGKSLVFNIGTGVGFNNKQVLDLLRSTGKERYKNIKLKILPARSFDVRANVLDYSRLAKAMGWKPKISLKKGLEQTWDYFLKTNI